MILLLIILQAITCSTMLCAVEPSKKNALQVQAHKLTTHFKWIQRIQSPPRKDILFKNLFSRLAFLELSSPELFSHEKVQEIYNAVEDSVYPRNVQSVHRSLQEQDRLEIVTSVARKLAARDTLGSASRAIEFLTLCRTWGELTEKETRRVHHLFEVFNEKLYEKTDEKKEAKQSQTIGSRNSADLPVFHPRMPLRRTCSLPSIPAYYLARTRGMPAQSLMPLPLPVILTDPEIQPTRQESPSEPSWFEEEDEFGFAVLTHPNTSNLMTEKE